MNTFKHFLLALCLVFSAITVLEAQESQPVVYGIFFYSPTCPHCHEVINNHWDNIQSEFGDSLKVIFVNITVSEGSQLMQLTRQNLGIEATGVPMLLIGDEVLLGSIDIPARAPEVIRAGLASGGINVPSVPGIEALFIQVYGDDYAANVYSEVPEFSTVFSDPLNVIAIVILIALVISIVMIIFAGIFPELRPFATGKAGYVMLILSVLTGLVLSLSILAGSDSWQVSILVLITGGIMLLVLVQLFTQLSSQIVTDSVVPLLSIAGLIVAGYLSYVEMSATDAVCGLAGNCNVVQQSSYAQIAGIPIGVIGIAGYTLLLLIWFVAKRKKEAFALMLFFAGAGVLFSSYLTYLEPFVIGASCAWCLTSALLMLALVWAVTPLALETMQGKKKMTPHS